MDEEEKKKILERREAHKKLSEIIAAGTAHCEPVTVKGMDGQDHEVDVYALSDEQFKRAIRNAGVNPRDLETRENLMQHIEFAQAVAPIATRDPDICKVIKPAESFAILKKVLDISDFPFRANADIREKPVQPTA